MIIIPRHVVELVLERMVPLGMEVLTLFKQNAEPGGLPPRLRNWIEVYGVRDWAKAYQNPNQFLLIHAQAMAVICTEHSDHDEPHDSTSPSLTPDASIDQIWAALENFLDEPADVSIYQTCEEEKEALTAMSEIERDAYVQRMRTLVGSAMIVVMNYFACMAYRKSMFQLVDEAIKGNRKSLLKAIHIDQSCIESIEHLRRIISDAALSPKNTLVARVQEWRLKPPLSSAVELPGLYLVFSLLTMLGLIDQFKADLESFAELCQRLQVYGPPVDEDIVDIENFSAALKRFQRDFSTPVFIAPGKLIVKDTV